MRDVKTIPSLSGAQMKIVDSTAEHEFLLPPILLMENAARAVAEMARDLLDGDCMGRSVVIFTGKGNNGGDGLAAARHLIGFGCDVVCVTPFEPQELRPIVKEQFKRLKLQSAKILRFENRDTKSVVEAADKADLIIDALLGTDAKGDPSEPVSFIVDLINSTGKPVLAVDVPTGLNSDTGEIMNPCVKAACTLTLALPKTGLVLPQSRPVVGDLYLADIGIPHQVYKQLGIKVDRALFCQSNIVRVKL